MGTLEVAEGDGVGMLSGTRNRVILGARGGFSKRRQEQAETSAPTDPQSQPNAVAVESRSCSARQRERSAGQASGVPENRENASITRKKRIAIPINRGWARSTGRCVWRGFRHTVAVPATGTWALALAAGEGSRLRALTAAASGALAPKQFCSLYEGPSQLHAALCRARTVPTEDRIFRVLPRHVFMPFQTALAVSRSLRALRPARTFEPVRASSWGGAEAGERLPVLPPPPRRPLPARHFPPSRR